MTPAEQKALDALHAWLHDPAGDCDLIAAAQDYHEALDGEGCDRLEREAAAQDAALVVGIDPTAPGIGHVTIMRRSRIEIRPGVSLDPASLTPVSLTPVGAIVGVSADPTCDRCRMPLARYHGPGIEDHGFTCLRCDPQP